MTIRAVYTIYSEPVPLKKVVDGLWVAATPPSEKELEAEYFKSAELFKKPMKKPTRKSKEPAPAKN